MPASDRSRAMYGGLTEHSVLIVEDDETVASINCRLVTLVPRLRVSGVARSARVALSMVVQNPPDLILLDLGLDIDGVALLRKLRSTGTKLEVIAVTSASSAEIVRATMQLGVLDYIVKPFKASRLRESLERFVDRTDRLQGRLHQQEIDSLRLSPNEAALPCDLAQGTLDLVRGAMSRTDRTCTADDVAREVGLARVTARRYLEYLVTAKELTVSLQADGGRGRPRKTYNPLAPQLIKDKPSVKPTTGVCAPGGRVARRS